LHSPDVIGHSFLNVQLIADQFAANGYFVVIPDMFHGDTVSLNPQPGFDFMKWMGNHPTSEGDEVTQAVIKELKEKYGAKKIGTVGYCWGAKYCVRFLKKGQTDAAFVAHPSFVAADELKAIEGPLSIAAAGNVH
jgi:dienelactone hydrolase